MWIELKWGRFTRFSSTIAWWSLQSTGTCWLVAFHSFLLLTSPESFSTITGRASSCLIFILLLLCVIWDMWKANILLFFHFTSVPKILKHRLQTLTINFRSIWTCMWVIISIGLALFLSFPFHVCVSLFLLACLLALLPTKFSTTIIQRGDRGMKKKIIFSILDQMFFVVSLIVL